MARALPGDMAAMDGGGLALAPGPLLWGTASEDGGRSSTSLHTVWELGHLAPLLQT